MLADRIGTTLRSVAKFVDDDGTERHVACLRGVPPRPSGGDFARQQGDARIGVGKEFHSSGSRSSNWPCGARSRSGIDPATCSKKSLGQPFSSTSSPWGHRPHTHRDFDVHIRDANIDAQVEHPLSCGVCPCLDCFRRHICNSHVKAELSYAGIHSIPNRLSTSAKASSYSTLSRAQRSERYRGATASGRQFISRVAEPAPRGRRCGGRGRSLPGRSRSRHRSPRDIGTDRDMSPYQPRGPRRRS